MKAVFYQRASRYVIQINDFKVAKNMMAELFRCINEQFLKQGDARRKNLIISVQSHKPFEIPDDNDDEINDKDPFECDDIEPRANIKRNKFHSFIQQMANAYTLQREAYAEENVFDKVKTMDAANPLFAHEIRSTMVEMISRSSLYGDILHQIFETSIEIPSSSAPEVTSRVMKRQVFQCTTIIADRWITKHLRFLNFYFLKMGSSEKFQKNSI